ncbi:hypothetical protein Pfo_031659 [Paulownia fortunei]|nr:hypothetical protein Pfo_031659 [Paulownia fortunei]
MSMVAAGTAITRLIAASSTTITLDEILAAHQALMEADPDLSERPYAAASATCRTGSAARSTRPAARSTSRRPPEEVPALLDDLIAFSNRDDVEPVTQAAIAHAQFESIHPFTDGNGRIAPSAHRGDPAPEGRHATHGAAGRQCPRRRHDALLLAADRVPEGDAVPIVTDLALCVETAAREARGTARVFAPYEAAWREQASPRGRQRRRPDPAGPAVAAGVHRRAARRRARGRARAERLPWRAGPRGGARRRGRHRAGPRPHLRRDGRARRVRGPRHPHPRADHKLRAA